MGRFDPRSETYDGFALEHLTCYGCVYSSWTEPFPGQPGGGEACQFCVRNRLWRQHIAGMERVGKEPEFTGFGQPYCVPMDAYISMDMKGQVAIWIDKASKRDSEALERMLATHERLHSEEN